MTDPLDHDCANPSATFGRVLAAGAAVLFVFLIFANYSGTTNTNTANNNAPNATSNSPPRIPPSTTGFGAQPEQPTPDIHGGPSR